MLTPPALLAVAALAAVSASDPRLADDDAVKAADAAMSDASRRRDVDAFLALVAHDAVFAGARGLAAGKRAVRDAWAPFFAPGGPSLTWAPDRAVVAASGDLAFTVGRYRLVGETTSEGEYVTVWRRAGGAWRAALDASYRPASALGPGLRRAPVRTVRSRAGDLEATAGRWRRAPRDGGAPEEGTFLTVRRRAAGRGWQVVLDAAARR